MISMALLITLCGLSVLIGLVLIFYGMQVIVNPCTKSDWRVKLVSIGAALEIIAVFYAVWQAWNMALT